MEEHLTRDQIVRYVNRSGDVDEILDVAQHLDRCDDCRDDAAAIAAAGDEHSQHGEPRAHR